jgi:hypothetical protein
MRVAVSLSRFMTSVREPAYQFLPMADVFRLLFQRNLNTLQGKLSRFALPQGHHDRNTDISTVLEWEKQFGRCIDTIDCIERPHRYLELLFIQIMIHDCPVPRPPGNLINPPPKPAACLLCRPITKSHSKGYYKSSSAIRSNIPRGRKSRG